MGFRPATAAPEPRLDEVEKVGPTSRHRQLDWKFARRIKDVLPCKLKSCLSYYDTAKDRKAPSINASPSKPNRPNAAERMMKDIVISKLSLTPLPTADCIIAQPQQFDRPFNSARLLRRAKIPREP